MNDNILASENTAAENEIDMSLHKKKLIIEHRTLVQHMKKNFQKFNEESEIYLQNTLKPRLNNANFNPKDKFKPIFFNEIDTTEDHVLKGFVLTLSY